MKKEELEKLKNLLKWEEYGWADIALRPRKNKPPKEVFRVCGRKYYIYYKDKDIAYIAYCRECLLPYAAFGEGYIRLNSEACNRWLRELQEEHKMKCNLKLN